MKQETWNKLPGDPADYGYVWRGEPGAMMLGYRSEGSAEIREIESYSVPGPFGSIEKIRIANRQRYFSQSQTRFFRAECHDIVADRFLLDSVQFGSISSRYYTVQCVTDRGSIVHFGKFDTLDDARQFADSIVETCK